MWPLLQKDGLATQYIALTLLWNRLIGHSPFISLRQATFLDVFTWVRSFTFRPHVGLLNPPVRRWSIWDALYFTCWSLYIDHRHDTPTYSPSSTYF
jgi:hypothetical protein